MRAEQARARYFVSLAYNHAVEAGTLPGGGPESTVVIDGFGGSMKAFFRGWYLETAVIDVYYLDEKIAVGWLLRVRGQSRLAEAYVASSAIFHVPLGEDTKLLGRTGKSRIEGAVLHLRQTPEVYCSSNTPCL